MKKLGVMVILLASVSISIAKSTQLKNTISKENYFYSTPEESLNEWTYIIPECSKLMETDKASLKKCETFGIHKTCTTMKDVELLNIVSHEKKKFKLIFHVFTSLKYCADDRTAALNGE